MRLLTIIVAAGIALSSGSVIAAARQLVALDGEWQIAEGTMDTRPASFGHRVPVPGLLDMAKPAFTEVGHKSPQRQAFWCRREFTLRQALPEVALLKIHKAQFGAKVWLNGQLLGEHLPCFTPAWLDAKPALKGDGQANELLVRVGANRESLPQDMPTGWDFEKSMKDAFAPTGLMLDFWAATLPPGTQRDLAVIAINDLYQPWTGEVRLRLLRGTTVVSGESQPCHLAALGDTRLTFPFSAPATPGSYTLEAALLQPHAPPVRSLRDFSVP